MHMVWNGVSASSPAVQSKPDLTSCQSSELVQRREAFSWWEEGAACKLVARCSASVPWEQLLAGMEGYSELIAFIVM